MSHFKKKKITDAIKQTLLKFGLGRRLILGLHPSYNEEFDRVLTAADAYYLRGKFTPKHLRFRLCRCIHRIEKGLSMPVRRPGAGKEVMLELASLLDRWKALVGEWDEICAWGGAAASAYFAALDRDISNTTLPDEKRRELGELKAALSARFEQYAGKLERVPPIKTPLALSDLPPTGVLKEFEALISARRSVRRWLDEPVPQEVLSRAVEHGLRAPSACNRQPFGVVAIESRPLVEKASALLTGGGGFAGKAPMLVAILSDYSAYEGHEHRKLPYSDGGMAAMLFLLSLTAQGYSTVCMNWAVDVQRDKKMRTLLGIEKTEVILFFVGVGKSHPEALIPASLRKPASVAVRFC